MAPSVRESIVRRDLLANARRFRREGVLLAAGERYLRTPLPIESHYAIDIRPGFHPDRTPDPWGDFVSSVTAVLERLRARIRGLGHA